MMIQLRPGRGDRMCSPVTLFILLAIAFLAGCVPVTDRSPVALELPTRFSASGSGPLKADWWLDFQDQELNLLIGQALSDNFSLLAARERILAAAAAKTQASASLFPSLEADGAVSSTRNYQTDTTTDTFSIGLTASYEIDLWNRLQSLADAAELEVQATEADYQTAAISLSAQVASTWFQLTEKLLQQQLLTGQRETNGKILSLIDIQFRSGLVPITDVLQQKQLIESNSGDLAVLKAEIRILHNQLALLLGKVPSDFTPPQITDLPPLPDLPNTGIPSEILTDRPDLRSSFLQLQAADKQVSAAIANQYPRLAITGDVTTSADRARDLFDNWFTTLAANLFGPVFDAGSRKAAVREKEAVARQLFLAYKQSTLEAVSEVENALVQEQQQREVLASLRRRLELATETVSRLSVRYRQGAADYQEVLLALRSKQGLEQSILTSRRQLLDLRISLHRAVSGRIQPSGNPTTENTTPLNTSSSSGESIQ